MVNELIPDINATGIFVLRPPFDALIPPQTKYSVKGVRKLSEVIASGVDPFSLYYLPNSISQADYEVDIGNDISVVSLCSEIGQWLYIPANYIVSYPDTNGVIYTSVILGVSLGSIANNALLDALKASIFNIVKDHLGVLSEIKEVVVSPPSIIPFSQHVLIEQARTILKANNKSDRQRCIETNDKLVAATNRIIELENYIKSKLL